MYRNALEFRVLVTRLRLKYSPALNFTLDPFDSDRTGHVMILFCRAELGILANLVRVSCRFALFSPNSFLFAFSFSGTGSVVHRAPHSDLGGARILLEMSGRTKPIQISGPARRDVGQMSGERVHG